MLTASIYHVATVADWTAAQSQGDYRISSRGRSLHQEGFIHCAFAAQVAGVLRRFYADAEGPLCLLEIDPGRLTVNVVAENLDGGAELFPHIYGPLDTTAVVQVHPLRRDEAGWSPPESLS